MRKLDLSRLKTTEPVDSSVLSFFSSTLYYANSTANGVVKLIDSTSNTSATIAASANSVKATFDLATTANSGLATAYSNAASYADTRAAAAYANGVTYTNTLVATGYANSVAYANTIAATAYSNALSQATTLAATAYTNAVAYAASNTYVNTQLGLKADLAGATFTGAVTVGNTLSSGNTTVTGFANVTGSLQVGGVLTVAGNLVINGTTTTINTSSINVTDSLLYLATNNEISDTLDIGFGAHYNNGAGANGHTGLVRSATTKKYYLFQNYQPELYSNNNIDFANTGTGIQMADLVVGNLVANSTLTVIGATTLTTTLAAGNTTITGFANVSVGINTPGTLSANVILVSNVSVTQQNLQVDAAGTATAMAIVFGG